MRDKRLYQGHAPIHPQPEPNRNLKHKWNTAERAIIAAIIIAIFGMIYWLAEVVKQTPGPVHIDRICLKTSALTKSA